MRSSDYRISKNVLYSEVIKSVTALRLGIDNIPNNAQIANIQLLCERIFEPLRKGLGNHAIFIASFFRSPLLNIKIGGAKNSQHMALNGAAMDIDVDSSKYIYNYQVFEFIKTH